MSARSSGGHTVSSLGQHLRRIRGQLVSGYWFIPATVVATGSAAAVGLLLLDDQLDRDGDPLGFTGGPDSARELLSTIASSMLSLTALVFSITVVALQLASGQFSPRVLRTFLRDRSNQLTLGVFLATFLFALIVLREVRGEDGQVDKFVPGLSIATAFALVVVSVGFFVNYIHNIVNSIRVIVIIERIARETDEVIERVCPPEPTSVPSPPAAAPPTGTVTADRRGVVVGIDVDRLAAPAERAGVTVAALVRPGEFVARGMPLVAVHGEGEIDGRAVRAAVALDRERDLAEDPAYGFRQLVDIAERALSPGTNDPTTAVQCLDHLHDLLRTLATRPLLPRVATSDDGTVRAVAPERSWDDYVSLAFDEIRHWGAGSLQVHRRIGAALDDLATVVPPDRVPALDRQRRLLTARTDDLPAVERLIPHRG
ncbi:MAG: DUF2254 domain-containing protein [Acidimicrobiales bacterium]|nr:DUF2254 domain-containing protein [Acidimicrobiales bacterium]